MNARRQVSSIREQLLDLTCGVGRWRGSDVGQAARDKIDAARQHRQAHDFANSGGSIRTRHHWRKEARHWATIEVGSTERYDALAGPIQQRLEAELSTVESRVSQLDGQATARTQWLEQHPELGQRLAAIDRALDPTPTIQDRLRSLQVAPPGRDRGLGLEL